MAQHILLTGKSLLVNRKNIGGSGYIASHTAIELLKEGYKLTLLDNFCNSRLDLLVFDNHVVLKLMKLQESLLV